jgi:hypothetical protein
VDQSEQADSWDRCVHVLHVRTHLCVVILCHDIQSLWHSLQRPRWLVHAAPGACHDCLRHRWNNVRHLQRGSPRYHRGESASWQPYSR